MATCSLSATANFSSTRKLPVTANADVFGASALLVLATAAFAIIAVPRARRERDDAMTNMQAVVLRVEEYGRTRTIRAPAPITIGRAPTATLIVPDAQVSRLHARIDFSDGVLSVRDLDSRNGTLVNARADRRLRRSSGRR